jgi:hypothetical protein
VRLVTLHAVRVARRRAVSHVLVATLARSSFGTTVRVVALRALFMALPGLVLLGGVARAAARQERRGSVRKSTMAARAVLMSALDRDS